MDVKSAFRGDNRRGSASAAKVDATVARGANGGQSGESAAETSSMSVEYTFIKENKCHDRGRNVSRRGEIMLPPFLQGQRRSCQFLR
jgi:hypothetical protein